MLIQPTLRVSLSSSCSFQCHENIKRGLRLLVNGSYAGTIALSTGCIITQSNKCSPSITRTNRLFSTIGSEESMQRYCILSHTRLTLTMLPLKQSRLFLSVHTFQLDNCWRDINKVWYGYYATRSGAILSWVQGSLHRVCTVANVNFLIVYVLLLTASVV
jgi:hypothetical protein